MRKLELLLEKLFVLLNTGMQINRPDFTKKRMSASPKDSTFLQNMTILYLNKITKKLFE